jgi:hypothetical protein
MDEELSLEEMFTTRVWSAAELAYLAGFLDGEGTFTVYKVKQPNTTVYNALISASQNSRPVLDWIHNTFGGKIFQLNKTGNREVGYQWMLKEKFELIALLPQLFSYLKVKDLQARLLLKYCTEFKDSCRGHLVSQDDHELRTAYCGLFTDLNSVGKGSTELKAETLRLIVNSGISLP